MSQVEALVEALEAKYKVSIPAFIEEYQKDSPREEMATALDVGEWAIRAIASALNLRMAKKHRRHDYSYFLSRFTDTAEGLLTAELTEAQEDLDFLSKELVVKEKALLNAHRSIAKYRRGLKDNLLVPDYQTSIKDAIEALTALPEIAPLVKTETSYTKYTQVLMLSDLHFEEAVSKNDVGSNEFNWDIAAGRLDLVFQEFINAHRGESSAIVAMLGDMISGIIHDTLESTTKPTGQAVAELASILAQYLIQLSALYMVVYVPCVTGNHGRISENKKSSGTGFNFEYLMYEMIKGLVAKNKNIIMDISTTGLNYCQVGNEGRFLGFHHGDFFRFVGDVKFLRIKEAFRQTLGIEPDAILQGHTHCFQVEEMPRGGKYITNGSLIGVNGYSHTNGMLGKNWGQVALTLLPNGSVENVRLIQ